MGEHKTNPGAANNGEAPPTLAEAMERHVRALIAANTLIDPQSRQGVMQVNPAQLFSDLALTELRLDVLCGFMVSLGLIDGVRLGDALRTRLLSECERLEAMKPVSSSILLPNG